MFSNFFYKSSELKTCGFKSVGKNVQIHNSLIIHGFENISIGDNVRIDPFVNIIASDVIEIGSYVHIGAFSLLSASNPIIMEDFAGLSQGVKIYTHSADYSGESLTNPTVPKIYKQTSDAGSVILRKHVIIGAGAVILPNLEVGTGCSVGALSLVNKSLHPWGVYAGIPARHIKNRSKKLLQLESKLKK